MVRAALDARRLVGPRSRERQPLAGGVWIGEEGGECERRVNRGPSAGGDVGDELSKKKVDFFRILGCACPYLSLTSTTLGLLGAVPRASDPIPYQEVWPEAQGREDGCLCLAPILYSKGRIIRKRGQGLGVKYTDGWGYTFITYRPSSVFMLTASSMMLAKC